MKQFLCSIAIRPDLSKVDYFYPDDPAKTIVHSCFPAISMIANAGIKHGDELIVTPVVTNSSTSEANLNAFIAELTALEAKHNIKFTVEEPIRVELKETTAKHIAFFKSVSRSYKKGAELYIDLTFGSKVQAISIFQSLCVAESNGCHVKELLYGSYIKSEADAGKGSIYSLRSHYDITQLLNTYSMLPDTDLEKLLDSVG